MFQHEYLVPMHEYAGFHFFLHENELIFKNWCLVYGERGRRGEEIPSTVQPPTVQRALDRAKRPIRISHVNIKNQVT